MLLSLPRAQSSEDKYNSDFKRAALDWRHACHAVDRESSEKLPDELRFSQDVTLKKGLTVRTEVQHKKKAEMTLSAKGIA